MELGSDANALPAVGLAPDLPPDMAALKDQSVDEIARDLKRAPIFMTSLDDAPADEPNDDLEAIKALMYDGTRLENAENFREQGNEFARARKWADGKEHYTKGLAALRVERKDGDVGEAEENGKETALKAVLLVNRALCHLELRTSARFDCHAALLSGALLIRDLGNYRSCTLDCRAALEIDPQNTKAYYRSAAAFLALDKLDEATAACEAGLLVDASNAALLELKAKVNAKVETQTAAVRRRAQETEQKHKEAAALASALKARKIRVRSTGAAPDIEDAAMTLKPDPVSPDSTLTFPVVLLYPLHAQSDFIKAFGEEQTLQGHLEYLLPLPWDAAGEYTLNGVEAYMETAEGGLVKWGKKVELLKVLSGGKVEVVDGIVRMNLVPKVRAPEWIEAMKKRKNAT